MDRLRKAALLTRLIEGLCSKGEWCGKTHVQKTTYFVQELMGVPLGFQFILYKHGPYSFGLRDELTALRVDGLLEREPRIYGAQLVPTKQCVYIQGLYPKTMAKYERSIGFVVDKLGGKRVVELERLGTAFFVSDRLEEGKAVYIRAKKVTELKPHIPTEKARDAVREVDRIASAAVAEKQEPVSAGEHGVVTTVRTEQQRR